MEGMKLSVSLEFCSVRCCSKKTDRRTGICHPTSMAGLISRIFSKSHWGGLSEVSPSMTLSKRQVRHAETVHWAVFNEMASSQFVYDDSKCRKEMRDARILNSFCHTSSQLSHTTGMQEVGVNP